MEIYVKISFFYIFSFFLIRWFYP